MGISFAVKKALMARIRITNNNSSDLQIIPSALMNTKQQVNRTKKRHWGSCFWFGEEKPDTLKWSTLVGKEKFVRLKLDKFTGVRRTARWSVPIFIVYPNFIIHRVRRE